MFSCFRNLELLSNYKSAEFRNKRNIFDHFKKNKLFSFYYCNYKIKKLLLHSTLKLIWSSMMLSSWCSDDKWTQVLFRSSILNINTLQISYLEHKYSSDLISWIQVLFRSLIFKIPHQNFQNHKYIFVIFIYVVDLVRFLTSCWIWCFLPFLPLSFNNTKKKLHCMFPYDLLLLILI